VRPRAGGSSEGNWPVLPLPPSPPSAPSCPVLLLQVLLAVTFAPNLCVSEPRFRDTLDIFRAHATPLPSRLRREGGPLCAAELGPPALRAPAYVADFTAADARPAAREDANGPGPTAPGGVVAGALSPLAVQYERAEAEEEALWFENPGATVRLVQSARAHRRDGRANESAATGGPRHQVASTHTVQATSQETIPASPSTREHHST